MNKTLKIGIMSREQHQKRILDIAAGRYKPKAGEPKIWFSSFKSLSEILSDKNIELLRIMNEQQPASMTDLAAISGRKLSNLSRTLKTLESHGIVEMRTVNGAIRPVAKAARFKIEHCIAV